MLISLFYQKHQLKYICTSWAVKYPLFNVALTVPFTIN